MSLIPNMKPLRFSRNLQTQNQFYCTLIWGICRHLDGLSILLSTLFHRAGEFLCICIGVSEYSLSELLTECEQVVCMSYPMTVCVCLCIVECVYVEYWCVWTGLLNMDAVILRYTRKLVQDFRKDTRLQIFHLLYSFISQNGMLKREFGN